MDWYISWHKCTLENYKRRWFQRFRDISRHTIKTFQKMQSKSSFTNGNWQVLKHISGISFFSFFAFPKLCILVPPKCTRIFWDVIVPICMNVKHQDVKFLVIFWLFFEGLHPNMYFIRQKLSLSSREKMAICYFLLSRYECRWFLPPCA